MKHNESPLNAVSIPPAFDVTIPTDEMLHGKLAKLHQLARSVTDAGETLKTKYVQLILHIHDGKYTPVQVTQTLLAAGFRAERISEIKNVAFASAEIVTAYTESLIGFKAALQLTRASKKKPTSAHKWNKAFTTIERLWSAGAKRQTNLVHIGDSCLAILVNSEPFTAGLATHTYELDGYRVTVDKIQAEIPVERPIAKKKKRSRNAVATASDAESAQS